MIGQGTGGSIVNIIRSPSTPVSRTWHPMSPSAKAGLAGLDPQRRLRALWIASGSTASTSAGPETEGETQIQKRFHDADDDWAAQAAERLPMGRLNQPDDTARFVVFLLSDQCGVVTGSVIDWDQYGGCT